MNPYISRQFPLGVVIQTYDENPCDVLWSEAMFAVCAEFRDACTSWPPEQKRMDAAFNLFLYLWKRRGKAKVPEDVYIFQREIAKRGLSQSNV